MEHQANLKRLSLNTITTQRLNLEQAVKSCVHHELGWIGLWRDRVAECGLTKSKKLIQEASLQVSGLIKGGMFSATTALEFERNLEENKRIVEEAAELGAKAIIMVGGGVVGGNLEDTRRQFEEGMEKLIPFAESYNVNLGLEPLHPMFAADRSVLNTMAQANDYVEHFASKHVGIIVDVFHVWWDPALYSEIARAKGKIMGFHVSDWLVPLPDVLLGRGMMGDGIIEFRKIRRAIEKADYFGPIEVEIFNQTIWDQPSDEVIETIKQRFIEHV